MNVIWKYQLAVVDTQVVYMPQSANALSVAVQNGGLVLWVMADQNEMQKPRTVHVFGTGNPMPAKVGRFIGTVQMHAFVWHVFVDEFGGEPNEI